MERLKIINDIAKNAIRSSEKYFKTNYNDLYNEILNFTSNIDNIQFKTRVWHWINNTNEIQFCSCGERTKFNGSWTIGSYSRNCSIKCSSVDPIRIKNNKDTLFKKYGVDNYLKTDEYKVKNIQKNLEKYGVEHYSKTDEYKIKVRETSLEKYGVENIFKLEIFRDRFKNTMLHRYGVDNPMKYTKFKSDRKLTCLSKYNVEYSLQSEIIKSKSTKKSLEKYGSEHHTQSDKYRNFKICNDINYIRYLGNNISEFYCEYGHKFEIFIVNYHARLNSNIKSCTICNPIGDSKSIKEKELLEYIKSIYFYEVVSGYRDGLEIDIYLPELNLGFEFNGLYFHSNKFKEKNYHLNKTDYFKEKGIRIIHIWEDDWVLRKEIVKSQISNLFKINNEKIFARKCSVKVVNIKDCKQFLDENHIQGKVNSSLKLGLYYEDELVSLMTFDHNEGRKSMEDGGWNLNRFCNKTGVNVVGGASKLLNYFIKNYYVKRIVSYADKDWSVGNLYEVLGFKNIGGNGPDYKYIVDGCRVHKSRYKKSKLNSTLTEAKQMELNGINKIYDCGKLKFEKVL
jgi:hypothetical protein